MREIKFRVWDKATKTLWSPSMNLTLVGGKATTLEGNFILMQYTGLKDKHGKEIYEGDIVKYRIPAYQPDGPIVDNIVAIEWNENTHGFRDADSSGEVIGNIYETPELLK